MRGTSDTFSALKWSGAARNTARVPRIQGAWHCMHAYSGAHVDEQGARGSSCLAHRSRREPSSCGHQELAPARSGPGGASAASASVPGGGKGCSASHLQMGHSGLRADSHWSMHSMWKRCLQGSTRCLSPSLRPTRWDLLSAHFLGLQACRHYNCHKVSNLQKHNLNKSAYAMQHATNLHRRVTRASPGNHQRRWRRSSERCRPRAHASF